MSTKDFKFNKNTSSISIRIIFGKSLVVLRKSLITPVNPMKPMERNERRKRRLDTTSNTTFFVVLVVLTVWKVSLYIFSLTDPRILNVIPTVAASPCYSNFRIVWYRPPYDVHYSSLPYQQQQQQSQQLRSPCWVQSLWQCFHPRLPMAKAGVNNIELAANVCSSTTANSSTTGFRTSRTGILSKNRRNVTSRRLWSDNDGIRRTGTFDYESTEDSEIYNVEDESLFSESHLQNNLQQEPRQQQEQRSIKLFPSCSWSPSAVLNLKRVNNSIMNRRSDGNDNDRPIVLASTLSTKLLAQQGFNNNSDNTVSQAATTKTESATWRWNDVPQHRSHQSQSQTQQPSLPSLSHSVAVGSNFTSARKSSAETNTNANSAAQSGIISNQTRHGTFATSAATDTSSSSLSLPSSSLSSSSSPLLPQQLPQAHPIPSSHQNDLVLQGSSSRSSNKLFWPPWPFNYLKPATTNSNEAYSDTQGQLQQHQHQKNHGNVVVASKGASVPPVSLSSSSPTVQVINVVWKQTRKHAKNAFRQVQTTTAQLWFHLPPATAPLLLLSLLPYYQITTSADATVGAATKVLVIPLLSNQLIRSMVLSGTGLAILSWAHSEVRQSGGVGGQQRRRRIRRIRQKQATVMKLMARNLPPFLPPPVPPIDYSTQYDINQFNSKTFNNNIINLQPQHQSYDEDDEDEDVEDDNDRTTGKDTGYDKIPLSISSSTPSLSGSPLKSLHRQRPEKVSQSPEEVKQKKRRLFWTSSSFSSSTLPSTTTASTTSTEQDYDDDGVVVSVDSTTTQDSGRNARLKKTFRFFFPSLGGGQRRRIEREKRKRIRQWERKVLNRQRIYDELVARRQLLQQQQRPSSISSPLVHSMNSTLGTGYALVTGASRGIGRALAVELARWNVPLILVARDVDALLELAEDIETCYGVTCYVVPADLSVPGTAEQIYETTTEAKLRVQYLINNAGISTHNVVSLNIPLNRIHRMIEVNTVAVTTLTQLYGREMMSVQRSDGVVTSSGSGGRILMVSSISGSVNGIASVAVYGATKAYENSYSYAIAKELEPYGVTVTCFQPGAVRGTGLRYDSSAHEALCWKVPFYPITPENAALLAVRGMFRGDVEVTPGILNRIFIKVVQPILPQRLHSLIAEMFWSPFQFPPPFFFSTASSTSSPLPSLTALSSLDSNSKQQLPLPQMVSTIINDDGSKTDISTTADATNLTETKIPATATISVGTSFDSTETPTAPTRMQ